MPRTKKVNCARCGAEFEARTADLSRGWGKFCSKSCKAQKQAFDTGVNGPHYKAKGKSVKEMRKGKFAKSKFENYTTPWEHAGVSKDEYLHYAREYGGTPVFNNGMYEGFIPDPFDNSQDFQNSEPDK